MVRKVQWFVAVLALLGAGFFFNAAPASAAPSGGQGMGQGGVTSAKLFGRWRGWGWRGYGWRGYGWRGYRYRGRGYYYPSYYYGYNGCAYPTGGYWYR
jgi:hypothetical protein